MSDFDTRFNADDAGQTVPHVPAQKTTPIRPTSPEPAEDVNSTIVPESPGGWKKLKAPAPQRRRLGPMIGGVFVLALIAGGVVGGVMLMRQEPEKETTIAKAPKKEDSRSELPPPAPAKVVESKIDEPKVAVATPEPKIVARKAKIEPEPTPEPRIVPHEPKVTTPAAKIVTPTPPTPAVDGDRAIAQWALSKKGSVTLAKPARKSVRSPAELPKDPFAVDIVQVTVKTGSLEMPTFIELPEITRLELTANDLADADIAALGAMPKLWVLRVSGPITDAALPGIVGHPRLKYIGLSRTKITDAGLGSVAKLPSLEGLRLAGSGGITDAGLTVFSGHDRLHSLDLTNCVGVTDGSLGTLTSMPKLDELYLEGTRITREGAAKLAQAMPRCRIGSDYGSAESKK